MKKVLLATTALVAFAGAASADVTLGGSARFGLQWNDAAPATMPSTTLEKRVTINVDFSTETDSGLELGGRVRLRDNEADLGTGASSANVYVKSGGFTLRVGNIHGAFDDAATTYSGNVGLNGNGFGEVVSKNFDGYQSSPAVLPAVSNNGAEVIYTAGDFKGHLSYSHLNDATVNANRIALVLGYTFGDWTAEIGIQEGDLPADADDIKMIGVNGSLGDFGVGFAYARNGASNDKYRVNASYTMGATKLVAYVADDDVMPDTLWGLGASYDLGGASLVGGYSHKGNGDNVASAGIKFKF